MEVSHYNIPLARGSCLGVEMIPRLRVTINKWRVATTRGQWPQAGNGDHRWRQLVVTNRE